MRLHIACLVEGTKSGKFYVGHGGVILCVGKSLALSKALPDNECGAIRGRFGLPEPVPPGARTPHFCFGTH